MKRITYAEQQGERKVIMRLLKKRFGEIYAAITGQTEDLSLTDLEILTEDILDFQSLQDLESWLENR